MKEARLPLPDTPRIAVKVIPKSSANRVEGYETDASGQKWLKVRITQAPEDGKANKALIEYLASYWKLPKYAFWITSGETSRYKIVEINR
jgi:uncharacterized protein (TIGR00251 family)